MDLALFLANLNAAWDAAFKDYAESKWNADYALSKVGNNGNPRQTAYDAFKVLHESLKDTKAKKEEMFVRLAEKVNLYFLLAHGCKEVPPANLTHQVVDQALEKLPHATATNFEEFKAFMTAQPVTAELPSATQLLFIEIARIHY